ncbi:hypothetical protein I552_5872 [Mycobacterium xenopi 3993]|nr:hypothetical protein I552_5872 [Mycobacterium xenopi 3993]
MLNLASARLITGRSDNPHQVRSSAIAGLRRGPVVGIPERRQDSRRPVRCRRRGWCAMR